MGVAFGLLVTFSRGSGSPRIHGEDGPRRPPPVPTIPLLLFALAEASAAGFARDLFTLFVAVELSATRSDALVAYLHKEEPRAIQAAAQYLLQGVTGTLTALLGVSRLYSRATPSLSGIFPERGRAISPPPRGRRDPYYGRLRGEMLGLVLLHTWLPDAYSGRPCRGDGCHGRCNEGLVSNLAPPSSSPSPLSRSGEARYSPGEPPPDPLGPDS